METAKRIIKHFSLSVSPHFSFSAQNTIAIPVMSSVNDIRVQRPNCEEYSKY